MKFSILIRALRLPFLSASVLPFIFGSLISRHSFDWLNFFLGLIAVIACHSGANLINDYADSKSGADWRDKKSYNFFGGSKLIQEGILSEEFYFKTALRMIFIAFLAVIFLSLRMHNPLPIIAFIIIHILGWSYSQKPLQLSYHKLGELIIFLLFGPALVMGGYFIQTGIFPDVKSFLLSLPCGILTTAILFANEVPDYQDDRAVNKNNWVSLTGQKYAYLLYALLMVMAADSIIINLRLGYLSKFSFLALICLLIPLRAVVILKNKFSSKIVLIESSKLTIAAQSLVTVVLILDKLLK